MEREKPVGATILAALAIAIAVWATIGPPPQRPPAPVKLAVGLFTHAVADQDFVDRLNALIRDLEREKIALHPKE